MRTMKSATFPTNFTTGYNQYPKNREKNLHIIDKHSKAVVKRTTKSKGTAFMIGGRFHRGGRVGDNRGGRGNKPFNKY